MNTTNKITKLFDNSESENGFWSLVERVKWPCDYNKAKIQYLKTLSKDDCAKFNQMIATAYNALDNVAHDVDGVGDDSYSDLLHHIIGLGRKEFYRHINNVKLIQDRANNSQYKESFAYCIPYESDYGAKNPYTVTHVVNLAKSSQKEIAKFRKMDGGYGESHLVDIAGELADIGMMMDVFINNPTNEGLEALVSSKSWVNKVVDRIDKFFEKNSMELPRKFTENGHNGICTPLFTNTVYDAEKVLEFLK